MPVGQAPEAVQPRSCCILDRDPCGLEPDLMPADPSPGAVWPGSWWFPGPDPNELFAWLLVSVDPRPGAVEPTDPAGLKPGSWFLLAQIPAVSGLVPGACWPTSCVSSAQILRLQGPDSVVFGLGSLAWIPVVLV